MTIDEITTHLVHLPLLQPWSVGSDRVTGKDHLLVRITSSEGEHGWGEMSPLPSFSGETGPGGIAVIDLFREALRGRDAFDIEGAHRAMERTVTHNTLAKSAVDLALHDLVSKHLQVGTRTLLGGGARKAVPLCWAVAVPGVDEAVAEAAARTREGFRAVKLKVGSSAAETEDRVRAIRNAVGRAVALRLDINGHYTGAEAITLIRRLEDCELEYVEQPARAGDTGGLAEVAHRVDTPVMVDEGVWSPADLIEVVRQRAASVVNIKISKLGGLLPARKAVAIAEGAGMGCMIGCMLEGGIGMLAGAHLWSGLPGITHACELIGSLLYRRDVLDISEFYEGGVLRVPTGPGLGIDESKLQEGES